MLYHFGFCFPAVLCRDHFIPNTVAPSVSCWPQFSGLWPLLLLWSHLFYHHFNGSKHYISMKHFPRQQASLALRLIPSCRYHSKPLFFLVSCSEIVFNLLEKPSASPPGLMKGPKSSAKSPRLFSMWELPEDEEEDEVWWKLRSDRYAEELVTLMGGLERWARQRRREKAMKKEAERDNSSDCSGTLPEDQLN